MKILSAVLFLTLIAVSPAVSQWKQNGKIVGDSPERKGTKGFGAYLIVVEHPREFMEEYHKPGIPNITTAKEVARGDSIGAFVLFVGCQKDAQGICNAEVDYTVYKPDGSIYAERKQQPLWKEQAPRKQVIELGKAMVIFVPGKDDPAGEYKVKAKVSDLNADISFELETRFRLK